MDLEQALETQRVKLLRLLAGWFALVGVLSAGPFQLPVPRWILAFFDTLLIRAELAAQYLLTASIFLQGAGNAVVLGDVPKPTMSRAEDDVPSPAELLRRMEKLRSLLENLPQHALQRSGQRQNSSAFDWSRRGVEMIECKAAMHRQWFAPRLARPPDIRCEDGAKMIRVFETSSRFRGGRRWRFGHPIQVPSISSNICAASV